MNAFNRINAAATKLEISAKAGLSIDKLEAVMLETAADLQTMLAEIVEHWDGVRSAMNKIDGRK